MKKRSILFVLTTTMIVILSNVFICSADNIASGDCGEIAKSVIWELDDKGTLVIYGQGNMMDYKDGSPFDEYANQISSVEINDGVTSIGYNAFANCDGIYSVNIPGSVSFIPDGTFSNCKYITIYCINGSYAHEYAQLNKIPYKEIEGDEGGGDGGDDVQQPDLPNDINQETIVESGECGINGVNIMWCLDNKGTLTIYGSGSMTWYSPYDDSSYGFPDSPFTALKDDISRIDIREGVTEIGMGAFRKCSNVTEVSVPDTVVRVQDGAFSECSGLTSVHLPDGVVYIGNSAFYGCINLTTINLASISVVKFQSFDMCKKLSNVVIPDGVVRIEEGAFYGCQSLERIIIPSSVEKLGESAFSGCSNLKSINIPKLINSVPDNLFGDCVCLMSIELPENVTKIGFRSFANCENLESIDLPNNVTTIGAQAFNGCKKLKRISIPSSVNSIGYQAFQDCISLTSISLPKDITSINRWSFTGCTGLVSITIPSNVTDIELGAFSGCSNLSSISLPSNLKTIGNNAFYECSNLTSIDIPSGVTTIERCTFWNCTGLRNVTFRNGITSIEEYAFYKCSNLGNITFPTSLVSIEKSAFWGCSSFSNIILPNSVTYIGPYAFTGCSEMTVISIPNSVNSIDSTAFSHCGLLTIACDKNSTAHQFAVDNYFTYVFINASGRYNEIIDTTNLVAHGTCGSSGDSIRWTIDKNGLMRIYGQGDMVNATDNYVPGVGSTSKSPFNCSERGYLLKNAKKVVIENGVTSIGNAAFYLGENIVDISIPSSVTRIGHEAFEGCSSIKELIIPDTVKYIESLGVFSNCCNLERLKLPDTLESTTFSWNTFYGCKKLDNLVIPEGITTIDICAFVFDPGLTTIYLPLSLKKVSGGAFDLDWESIPDDANNLKDIYYRGSESEWNAISIGSKNDAVINATKHFNYGKGEYIGPDASSYSKFYNFNYNSGMASSSVVPVQFDAGIYEESGKLTTMNIKWGKSLFSNKSTDPNNDLAIAALILSANAYTQSLETETLKKLGFSYPEYYNYNGYDDINRVGNCIAYTTETINGKKTNIIVVVCRGSNDLQWDWASNVLQQAQGFRYAANDVKQDLNDYIESRKIDTSLPTKIFITGHSRGAAVANILGTDVSDITSKDNVYVYTYACPNTTTETNRKQYKNIFNILNYDDAVTAVPIMNVAGAKFGKELWFTKSATTNFDYYFTTLTGLQDPYYILHHPLSWCNGTFGQQWMFAFRNHSPAVYMSYLLGSGVNSGSKGNGNRTRIAVECPVDVLVYDSENSLIGKITNNVPDDDLMASGINTVVDGDKKYLYVPGDREVRVELVGTDSGDMTYSVQRIDPESNDVVTETEFSNVQLKNGKTMTSSVGEDIATEDIQLFVKDNYSVAAEIDSSGNESEVIFISFDTGKGSKIRDVSVPKGGTVDKLPSPILEGYEFDNWYTDKACSNRFSYDTELNESKTLYAAFRKAREVYGHYENLEYDGNVISAEFSYEYRDNDSPLFTVLYQNGEIIAINKTDPTANNDRIRIAMPIKNLYGAYELKAFCINSKGSVESAGEESEYDTMFQCDSIDSEILHLSSEGESSIQSLSNKGGSIIPSKTIVGDKEFAGWYSGGLLPQKCEVTVGSESGTNAYARWQIHEEHQHEWNSNYSVDTVATCTSEGSESIHCLTCDAIKEGSSRTITKTAHTYGSWTTTKVATELATGQKARTCSGCGKTETSTIAQLKPTLPAVTITKPATAKKAVVVKWKKVSKKNQKKIASIQIQYTTDKNFKKGVKSVTAKKRAASKKISKLTSKKKYYVRVRAYKKDKKGVHVSKWSAVKAVKTK